MQKIVITGLGAVTPLGVGTRHSWRQLIKGHSGLVSVADRSPKFKEIPSTVAGVVPDGQRTEGGWNPKDWLGPAEERRMARFTHFALAAAQEALDDAQYTPKTDTERDMTGVVIGTGIGNLETTYDTSIQFGSAPPNQAYRSLTPHFVPLIIPNLAAGHLSIKHTLRGPILTPSSACTTGLHALISAAQTLRSGSAHVMLAGASESCIHPLALAGFARLKSLATAHNYCPQSASRPFDAQRSGFVLAEGAAVLVLETEEHARERGATVLAELAGWSETGDGWHVTSPPPGGEGAERAMRGALRMAGREAREVDYVNAHATGTGAGDLAEGRAIARVFGCSARGDKSPVAVSSTKGHVGHLVGAAGAVEALWTIMAIREGTVPPTKNLEELAPGLEAEGVEYVRDGPSERDVKVAISNSFGFGGTNASVCITKYEP